jgi:hypothetical protein
MGNLDAVEIDLDPQAPGTPISPLIYGVSMADAATLRSLGATVDRWGGNQSSRYNWANGHAWNAGRDWEFRNVDYAQPQTGSAADRFITTTLASGAQPLITIPTIGWVAHDGNNQVRSLNVPGQGGPPLGSGSAAVSGYDPTANRQATSVPSLARKPGGFSDPPDPNAPAVYQDEWVHHLVRQFGPTPASGPFYFTMDNEPDLWSTTHTDVHPVRMGYDAMSGTFVEYATAVKAVDPSARILGPDLWGWTSLFYSDLDRGSDNFATHADRRAHGGTPFLAWWLGQMAHQEATTGTRLLDYVDLHFYPQAPGVFSPAHDPATQALRIRSTRSLFDPTYRDESWIGEPVMLIPRLKQLVNERYPGTRLAITEYNWGAERDASGAVALAEVLGIFGREGVDLATYWSYPPLDSPAAAAFRIYRNFDGHGAAFGDRSLPVTSNQAGVTAFAARHSSSGEVDVILINQAPDRTATVHLTLPFGPAYSADLFQVEGGSAQIRRTALNSAGDVLHLGPYSITLVRLQPQR